MDFSIPSLVARIIILLFAFPIHELAHAVTADSLGDPTPRRMGRITLNPLAHLDLFGSIMIFLASIGWAKPVLVNPLNLRGNPRTSMAIVAAAGPLSNLVLAALGAIPIRFGLVAVGNPLTTILLIFVQINVFLAFFNLIPIPPLDGYKILTGVLPADIAFQLRPLEQYGFLILIGAIFFLPSIGIDVLDWFVLAPSFQIISLLLGT